jgi:alpha-glucosidase
MRIWMICVHLALFMALAGARARAESHELKSPDGRISVRIETDKRIRYSVSLDGRLLTGPNPLSMTLGDGRVLGENARQVKADRQKVKDTIVPPVKIKNAVIDDVFNELTLTFAGSYFVVFRAYDDGLAYRFGISEAGPVTVTTEDIQYRFDKDHNIYFPAEDSFHSHQERLYRYVPLSSVGSDKFCSIPMLVDAGKGVKVAISESDLRDYPGFYLAGQADAALKAVFPAVATKEERTNDRNVKVVERAGYIAETSGPRRFPWRAMVVAGTDADLVTSEIIYKLGAPCRLEDVSWIKPGKVAWDWYNANNVFGVDFRAGINTETYKFYIDFASKYGLEYVILDEGWYPLDDVMKVAPAIDMEDLLEHAARKNVGLILWVTWKALDDQFLPALDKFERWGIKGIKVDFMQRDDQWMVNFYEKVLVEAAKRKLLVDFHGSYKPAGFQRTYPNFITSEGVKGNENNKWSADVDPRHTLTIPFIRMLAGPMDFTPGAMRSAQKKNFRPVFDRPMSLGTRCRQLAMYVLYESPLQMLCDSPSLYLGEPECMEFLAPVPTVWDRTLVLDAKIGERLIMARRNGRDWYIGGMTGDEAARAAADLSFLGAGEYTLTLFRDGLNADRWAEDYSKVVRTVTAADKIDIAMAPGGGFAGRLVPKQ